MLVQTYEVEETTSEAAGLAADHEALELIDSLNLVGQLNLTNRDTVERFPYRKLAKTEAQVFGVLCPQRTKLESYSDGIIPLRVLQVAAHVQRTGYCDYLEVWHPENADIKDPFLIGCKKSGYDYERYLLARWGEELLSMEEMAACAKKIWAQKLKVHVGKIQREVEALAGGIDHGEFELGHLPTFYA